MIGGFRSVLCVSVFQGSLIVIVIMIDGSEKPNRQYSYFPTVLGRVGAGNFSPRGQTNLGKLSLSLPNLRKIFNIVKFRRAYILERSLFQTTKGRSAHYY